MRLPLLLALVLAGCLDTDPAGPVCVNVEPDAGVADWRPQCADGLRPQCDELETWLPLCDEDGSRVRCAATLSDDPAPNPSPRCVPAAAHDG